MEQPQIEFKIEAYNPENKPPQMEWVHDKAGLRVLARNKHASTGIPSLLKKMTGMVVSGGFDGARMAFPSNMYFQ